MKKLKLSNKGFAMAELLAVSIAVLSIFSILFSNYLPLAAEYENRINYNNVTAQYAAHYIRKAYIDTIAGTPTLKNMLVSSTSGGHMTIYNGSYLGSTVSSHIFNEPWKSNLQNLITEYGIEEIIITRYNLETVKNKLGKSGGYPESGAMYDYIKYLPKYSKSSSSTELFRIILKTKDFGYATVPIFTGY